MSHGDEVTQLPDNAEILAYSSNNVIAAIKLGDNKFGVQFHPEVVHTKEGNQLLENFLVKISGCLQNWTAESFVEQTITEILDPGYAEAFWGFIDTFSIVPPLSVILDSPSTTSPLLNVADNFKLSVVAGII